LITEKRTRKQYIEDFKRDAVALVTEQGCKVSKAAHSLGIGDKLLRRWKQEFADDATANVLNADEREELKRLQKGNRNLRMEKGIKKSQCIFCEGNEVKYRFIYAHAGVWLVKLVCSITSS